MRVSIPVCLLSVVCQAVASPLMFDRRMVPCAYPMDPSTISDCTQCLEVYAGDTCSSIASLGKISPLQFMAYNPALENGNCDAALIAGNGYCVEQNNGNPSTVTGTIPTNTPTPNPQPPITNTPPPVPVTPPTPIQTDNGIQTPQPIQNGQVTNCKAWEFVKPGDTCATIAMRRGITVADIVEWNPAVGASCTGIWANTYACVQLLPPSAPGPVKPGQPKDCNAWAYVRAADTCDTLAVRYHITPHQLYNWNPSVGTSCSGLVAHDFLCVGTVSNSAPPPPSKPTPTPTPKPAPPPPPPTNGAGMVVPSPVQPGQPDMCSGWHYVQTGETCAAITSKFKITIQRFIQLNPAVGSGCSSMWAHAYVCVSTK